MRYDEMKAGSDCKSQGEREAKAQVMEGCSNNQRKRQVEAKRTTKDEMKCNLQGECQKKVQPGFEPRPFECN